MRTEKKRTTKKKIGNEEKQKIESEIFNNNKNKKLLNYSRKIGWRSVWEKEEEEKIKINIV